MKPIDYLKALGLGFALLCANVLLLVAIVFVYSQLFARGHTPEFYNALATQIGGWSAPLGGFVLMALAGFVFAKRRPERNGLAFIGATWAAYAVIDTASGLAMTPVAQLFTWRYGLALLLALAGGLSGAARAAKR